MLYVDDFANESTYNTVALRAISELNKSEKYLHEMTYDDLSNYVLSRPRCFHRRRVSILIYLKWLFNNYPEYKTEEILDVYVRLEQIKLTEEDIDFCGFFTEEELIETVEYAIEEIEKNNDGSRVCVNTDSTKLVLLLPFYGFSDDDILEIKLKDVSSDGKIIHRKRGDVDIHITNDYVADFISNYKKSDGYKKCVNSPEISYYVGDTLFRTISNAPISKKKFSNERQKASRALNHEPRFVSNRILYSGRYKMMYEYEMENGIEFSLKKSGKNSDTFNASIDFMCNLWDVKPARSNIYTIIVQYKVYKNAYLKFLNENK